MSISEFMNFCELLKWTTRRPITQDQTNIVESWEILKNDRELLLLSVTEAYRNFDASYHTSYLDTASRDDLFSLFLKLEQARNIMEKLIIRKDKENYE